MCARRRAALSKGKDPGAMLDGSAVTGRSVAGVECSSDAECTAESVRIGSGEGVRALGFVWARRERELSPSGCCSQLPTENFPARRAVNFASRRRKTLVVALETPHKRAKAAVTAFLGGWRCVGAGALVRGEEEESCYCLEAEPRRAPKKRGPPGPQGADSNEQAPHKGTATASADRTAAQGGQHADDVAAGPPQTP